jgi:hypothetical protein
MRLMTDPADDAPPDGPDVLNWRLTDEDRALLLRVRILTKLKSNPEVLRFALGAAERELSRAGGRS